MASDRHFPIVYHSVQSKGPVLSGLMLSSGGLMASHILEAGFAPMISDSNNTRTIEYISRNGKEAFVEERIKSLIDFYKEKEVKIAGSYLTSNGFADNVRIHEELKKQKPDLFLVGGGPAVDWSGKEIFNYTDAFDVLSYGDGDPVVAPLARLVYEGEGNLDDIPNIWFRDRTTGRVRESGRRRMDIPLKGLPHPTYSKEFYPDIDGKIMIAPREDSRSCPYGKCSFCVQTRIGGKYRLRPVEELAEEINTSGMIAHRSSGPSPKPDYVAELVKLIPGKSVSAFAYANPNYDYPEVSKGLTGVFIGLESTDRHILEDVLNKTSDTERYLKNAWEMVKEFKRYGVATIVAMMVPCPGETQATMERSLEYLVDLQPDFVVTLPMGPIPGTSITRRAKKDPESTGILLSENFEREAMLYELDLLQKSEDWPEPPFKTKVDGEFVNPFLHTNRFTEELMEHGMYPSSDEIALMAERYYSGLSLNQDERRMQVNGFMGDLRGMIERGDYMGLGNVVETINNNNMDVV
jgi:radical SAM superfamily enzyme YgiQ (UPF0313 family)